MGMDTRITASVTGLVILLSLSHAQEVRDICRWESFNASCPQDHVVVMESAHYGRMKMGRCLNRNYMVSCSADVIRQADERCSGLQDCVIQVPDKGMHEAQPCPKDVMAYLEASYRCVPVVTVPRRECTAHRPLLTGASSGYLSSSVTESLSIGTTFCPWVLRVGQGQRINVTLMDFSTLSHDPTSAMCKVYASIRDSESRDVTVCAGGERLKHIMISDNNELEVSIVSHRGLSEDPQPQFLIKYEATGCADFHAPIGGWSKRDGEGTVVGCNGTSSRWHLVCRDNHWIGEVHNCTAGGAAGGMWSLGASMNGGSSIPYGLLISVAIGVILGVILGTLMLTLVLVCRKWKRRDHRKDHRGSHAGTLLKPHPEKFPMPPNSATVERVYAPPGLPHRVTSPKNKNGGYAHIWELRQGMMGYDGDETYTTQENGRRVNLSDPGCYYSREDESHKGGGYSQEREHVYESPKPDRRDDEHSMTEGPYYHEFDTQVIDHGRPSFDMAYPEDFDTRGLREGRGAAVDD